MILKAYLPLCMPPSCSGLPLKLGSKAHSIAGMNDALLGHNMSVQYCMGLAHEMLMALKLPAVTSARASEDNFPYSKDRWQIGYTSLLYGAVALRCVHVAALRLPTLFLLLVAK